MDDGKISDNHATSAAAFVEGGIQDACDDACSICLEAFSDSDPSSVTSCKHEFHLQCILEWCQRSSNCPMCWQPISLKDPISQELLENIVSERTVRVIPARNSTIFHHPTLGDFELQHLPSSTSESELEERIIQHLAAAAAMGRARQLARREGHRGRSSAQGRPHFVVFSAHPNGAPTTSAAVSVAQRDVNDLVPAVMIAGPNSPFITMGEDSAQLAARPSSPQIDQLITAASGSNPAASQQGTSSANRRSPQTSPQDRAGSSDFQSFSDSLKSRFSALSTRYKESITKSTRGWKDRLFARNNPTPDYGAEVHREPAQSISTVSRMMNHLQITEDSGTNVTTVSNDSEDTSNPPNERQTTETVGSPLNQDVAQAPCATSSASN